MSEGAPPGSESWLSRLWRNLRDQSADVIVANIGSGAKNVIVGKNIVHIGTVIVPLLPLVLVVVGLVLASILGAWLRLVPNRMNGAFNVAVADFGQVDANGHVRASEDGTRLSRWVFQTLQDEFKDMPSEVTTGLAPLIWHSSLTPFQTRANLHAIEGDSPTARQEAACMRAKEIGADILIFGNFTSQTGQPGFMPEFCVARIGSDPDRLDEMLGNHELGKSIPVRLPLDFDSGVASRVGLSRELSARINALSHLATGLVYDAIGDLRTAADIFEMAAKEPGWKDSDGKEILYYFIGKQRLWLGELGPARAAFEEALRLNREYIRGHIGLGSVHYSLAQNTQPPSERLSAGDLDTAIALYQGAIVLAQNARDYQLEPASHFALGTAYRLKGEAFLHTGELDSALHYFDLTIREINHSLLQSDPDQFRILAIAYSALGAAHHEAAHVRLLQGDLASSKSLFEQALGFYDQCIRQADAVPEDQFLAEKVKKTSCVPYRDQVLRVLAGL